jgi:sirohydrochlorin cobaltochelatase
MSDRPSPPSRDVDVHPIEQESYRRLADHIDLSVWQVGARDVVARVIHATADPILAESLIVPVTAVDAGTTALAGGAPILCDVEMVRAGISGASAICTLGEVADAGAHPSRSAAAMALAARRHPDGAVIVVGCAPTALAEVNRLIATGALRPALVIGTPVGYVGAAEAKDQLLSVSADTGVPAIVLRGERGGAAVAAAALNALLRLSRRAPVRPAPALLLVGHGTRSRAGQDELQAFATAVSQFRPSVGVRAGFIEFVEPDLDRALDDLVAQQAQRVVAVPLLLFGAGHLKDDGPGALARARLRHPGIAFSYGRDLGVHPLVLEVAAGRASEAAERSFGAKPDAIVVVGRGSTDPDANADLAKAARLLADGRDLTAPTPEGAGSVLPSPELGLVEPAFVSLARPGLATALDRVHRLGARRIVVVPYFLFTGVLVERIGEQAANWAGQHPHVEVVVASQFGVDERLVSLTWNRYDEALGAPVTMNCDGCLYRVPLPGYEHRVGQGVELSAPAQRAGGH